MGKINPSEITPEQIYISRRDFMAGAGALLAGTLLLPGCTGGGQVAQNDFCSTAKTGATADELGNKLTSCKDVTNYNNYYEFTTSKTGVASLSKNFNTAPWTVAVGGLVNNPKTYTVDELTGKFPPEERVYRLRCVETWSMVVPWQGFPLASLLNEAGPTSKAKFVRFQTVMDPARMPGQKDASYDWPYIEGLRLDEAMHRLTILATGIYGKPLPPQDGAPIRLVVPWKYGFKYIKSIVKIDLVEEMPTSFWMNASPTEYGFYANVNPAVSHPRWSQASERRIGELTRINTLPFNGYADEVAGLYAGMDLKVNF
jgi:sulfoxide reductase catalytic subunit YedY